jgi:hypothetical protein
MILSSDLAVVFIIPSWINYEMTVVFLLLEV